MKVTIGNHSNEKENQNTFQGGTLTQPLILANNPTQPMEAATKQYVDNIANTKSNISHTHTFSQISNWPDQVTSSELSHLSGVTSNIQTQLNEKASIDFVYTQLSSKVNKSGDTLTGFLTLHANPTNNFHAVTKQYADSLIPTGSIIGFTTQTTPPGFLRCNGASVSKSTYAKLYSVIGDTYTKYEPLGYGYPHIIQTQFNEYEAFILSNWSINNNLLQAVSNYSVEVIKGKIYIIGGYSGSTYYNILQKISLNNDGTIASVTTHSTTLPQNIAFHSSIVIQNYIYIIGGRLSSGTSLDTVYRATIDENGEIGTFSLYATLPTGCDSAPLLRIKNFLYLFAGRNGTTMLNTIYRFNIQNNGDIIFTSPVTTAMPQSTYGHVVTVHKDRVFILGGLNSSNTSQTTTFVADILPDGTLGSFTSSSALPVAQSFFPIISTKNALYNIRTNNTNITNVGLYSFITNSITWYAGNTNNGGLLSTPTSNGVSACIVNNYLYLFALSNTVNIARCPFKGGYNDYSNLITEYNSANFGLPDLTLREYEDKIYYYIKT